MGARWSLRCFARPEIMSSIFSVTPCLRGEVLVRHSDAIESPFNSLHGSEVGWQPGFSTEPK